MSKESNIKKNIKIHDVIATKYDDVHREEIFNIIEQNRLKSSLKHAIEYLGNNRETIRAFDYGCGTGNLTNHFIDLGCTVTAADVSPKSLEVLAKKYSGTGSVETCSINGSDIGLVKNDEFDISATYSVLHHVPDYLSIIREMIRITRSGGIIYLDHEVNDAYWKRIGNYRLFLTELEGLQRGGAHIIKNYFEQFKYRIQKILRYQAEGDIHVWPDDHIEWERVKEVLLTTNCEIVSDSDYLLYQVSYPMELYNKYKHICGDYRCIVARKRE